MNKDRNLLKTIYLLQGEVHRAEISRAIHTPPSETASILSQLPKIAIHAGKNWGASALLYSLPLILKKTLRTVRLKPLLLTAFAVGAVTALTRLKKSSQEST